MNLLLIDSVDFPSGGAHSVHVGLLMKGLRENNQKAFLIVPYGSKRETISGSKNKYGHFGGIPYCFVRYSRKIQKGFRLFDIFIGVLGTAALIYRRKKRKKIDAVILGGIVDVFRDSPIITMCAILRIPVYFWFVEKASLSEDYRGMAGFLNFKSQQLSEKYLPRFATGIIVITSILKEHYLKYLPDSKILISPILVSDESRRNNGSQSYQIIQKKFATSYKDKRLLVYSGSFGEKDGLYNLIEALAQTIIKYPNTVIVMTGKNDNSALMSEFRDHIKKFHMEDNVEMVGFVNADELLCYNTLAEILFVCRTNSPFANHGFPWKLGEYCMTAKPIIATRVSDIDMYFTNNESLFIVEPNEPGAIADMVNYIFEDYEHALEVAARGKNIALKHFGYYNRAREIGDFIERNGTENAPISAISQN